MIRGASALAGYTEEEGPFDMGWRKTIGLLSLPLGSLLQTEAFGVVTKRRPTVCTVFPFFSVLFGIVF